MTTPATPALLPAEAVEAAAVVLHDEACQDDAKNCGRWMAGSDPASRFHANHVGHVEFYRQRAREALAAAAPHLASAERDRLRGAYVCRRHDWENCEDISCQMLAEAVAAEQEAAEARHMEYLSKLTREYDANLRASVAAAAHEAICWEQPADGRLIACDRKKDHKGGHSWEAADAVAAERERCAQEVEHADTVRLVGESIGQGMITRQGPQEIARYALAGVAAQVRALDLLRQGGGT